MRCLVLAAAVVAALARYPAPEAQPTRDLKIEELREELRIALVIGNGAYGNAPLRNPANDARGMAQMLRGCGFDVIERIDVDRADMREAIREFERRIRRGGVGMFFFAGHGMQVNGRNFLVPVDADVEHENEVEDECVDAALVLRKMADAGNRLNIVVLDACRNNPFARSFRSATRGLAQMDAATGSIVCYATAPGSVAEDGDGDNGLYTSVLLSHLNAETLELKDLLVNVRVEVMDRSGGRQIPWESSSLTGPFYFVPPAGAGNTPPVANAGPDLLAQSGSALLLDGRRSVDVDGDALSYCWQQTGGPPADVQGNATATPTVRLGEKGTYEFALTVSDGRAVSGADSVAVQSIGSDNRPPVADAGQDLVAGVGQLVELDGSQSQDPEGGALEYEWMQTEGNPVVLLNADSAVAGARIHAEGLYRFALVVRDAQAASEVEEVVVQGVIQQQAGGRRWMFWALGALAAGGGAAVATGILPPDHKPAAGEIVISVRLPE